MKTRSRVGRGWGDPLPQPAGKCIDCGASDLARRNHTVRRCRLCQMAFEDRPPGEKKPGWMSSEHWKLVKPKSDEQQEADLRWVVAHQSHEPGRGDVRQFDRAVLDHAVVDAFRRQQAENRKARRTKSLEVILDEPSVPSHEEWIDMMEAIHVVLARLPQRDASIFLMHRFQRLTIEEIAREFLIPGRSVLNSIERSTQAIRVFFPGLAKLKGSCE